MIFVFLRIICSLKSLQKKQTQQMMLR